VDELVQFYEWDVRQFLILFGTLYVSVVHGKETLAWLLYFPYIAGMVAAMIFGPAILGERSEKQLLPFLLLSFSGGLLISGMPYGFSIGIFILSFIRGTASSWLNQVYYDEEAIPADQRILAKFATQNKGSLTHQFGLMLILTAVTLFSGKPIQELLRITGRHSVTEAGIQLLEMTKWINIGMLLLGLLGIYYLWRKTAKNDEDIH
jgi:energy-coupling factor transporter transmembrane protein EcfT